MAYIAQKPCSFAGKEFKIGDEVPEEVLLPGTAKNMIKMQILAVQGAETSATAAAAPAPAQRPLVIRVHAKEGDLVLKPSQEGLQAVFDVITGKVGDAEETIAQMEDEDALILLHVSDNRKSVKEAVETRAKELNGEAGEE